VVVADGEYLRVSLLKLSIILRELEELFNSDRCESQGIEYEHNALLPKVVAQADLPA
jgi:hypothetical protein